MKWQRTLIYVLVLALVGGYFYYFEVVKKEQKDVAEREAKKVFHVKLDQIRAVDVLSGKNRVRLENTNGWQIVEPVKTDADQSAVRGFLEAIESAEMVRKVAPASGDLKPYGLNEPPLTIRFQVGEKWDELILGGKNPTGAGYYAKTGNGSDVFMIASGDWGSLNKGVNELRRRDLFTFQPEDVTGIQVTWQDGASVSVERKGSEGNWVAPAQADLELKKSKVENVIDQLKWLRAERFLENDSTNLEPHDLAPPYVTVAFQLKDGGKAELRLAKKKADAKKDVVSAVSSQLPGVVEVEGRALSNIPKSPSDLENRSFFSLDTDQLKRVTWKVGSSSGQVEKMADAKWGWKAGDEKPKAIEEQWRVRSLVWELQNQEYASKLTPAPAAPGQPYGSMEFWGDTKLESLTWEKPSEDNAKEVHVWVERNGTVQAITLKSEAMRKIESRANELAPKPANAAKQ